MERIVSKYLELLNIPISARYCESIIASHPDYPSILSVADAFERLGLDYSVKRIRKEEPLSIPYPFLIPLNSNGGTLKIIQRESDLKEIRNVEKAWDGIIIRTEPRGDIQVTENRRQLVNERMLRKLQLSLLLTMAGLISIPVFFFYSGSTFTLLLTVLAGVALGFVLMATDLGHKYESVDRFCSNGSRSGCDVILRSEGASILGVSLADAVLIYFLFQLACLVGSLPFTGLHNDIVALLGFSAVLASPVVVYSVYYQKFVAKTWCRLCLLVDGILLIQLPLWMIQFNLLDDALEVSILAIVLTVLVISFIASAVWLVKQKLQQAASAEALGFKAARIKNIPSVFNFLLLQNKKLDDHGSAGHHFILGNENASIKLDVVLNLYCAPCKKHFEKIVDLLAMYPDDIRVNIRLLKSGRNENETSTLSYIINYWLEHFYQKENEQHNIQKLIGHWYEVMNIDKFRVLYPSGATHELTSSVESAHVDWAQKVGIRGTPTVFVNDFQFPFAYEIDDLQLMIPGLRDIFQNEQTVNTGYDAKLSV